MRKNYVQYLNFHPVNLALCTTFYVEYNNEYAWIIFRVPNGDKIYWRFEGENKGQMSAIYQAKH